VASAWLTTGVVRAGSGLRPSTDVEETALELAADAAAEYVEDLHPELFTGQAFQPTARVRLGATMLANRWYQRRSSPLGIAGYAEMGGAGILRYDPDIARLLGIGTDGGAFVFGAPTTPVAAAPNDPTTEPTL
jgi:hypothetical protein